MNRMTGEDLARMEAERIVPYSDDQMIDFLVAERDYARSRDQLLMDTKFGLGPIYQKLEEEP